MRTLAMCVNMNGLNQAKIGIRLYRQTAHVIIQAPARRAKLKRAMIPASGEASPAVLAVCIAAGATVGASDGASVGTCPTAQDSEQSWYTYSGPYLPFSYFPQDEGLHLNKVLGRPWTSTDGEPEQSME